MPFRKLDKKPTNLELAKNVPAGGMHGYLPGLSEDAEYWENRNQGLVEEPTRPATFIVVREIHGKFAQLGIDMTTWQQFGAINRGLSRNAPGREGWNRIRCEMLGLAALSKLCQELLRKNEAKPGSPEARVTQKRDTTQIQAQGGFGVLPDIALTRDTESTPDARLHLNQEYADQLLGARDPEAENPQWYRSADGGLYVRREMTVDPTPECVGLAAEPHPQSLQTLFPYLPSRP